MDGAGSRRYIAPQLRDLPPGRVVDSYNIFKVGTRVALPTLFHALERHAIPESRCNASTLVFFMRGLIFTPDRMDGRIRS